MSIDRETINKFEEILAHRRSQDPLNIEPNRLANEIYPYEKLHSIFKLGSAQMLAIFKNHVYKYCVMMIKIILMQLLKLIQMI